MKQPDGEWNLLLVNRWNPLPENYTVDLVEVPGGQQVDERIYQPLMEMLEAAREGNWENCPRCSPATVPRRNRRSCSRRR